MVAVNSYLLVSYISLTYTYNDSFNTRFLVDKLAYLWNTPKEICILNLSQIEYIVNVLCIFNPSNHFLRQKPLFLDNLFIYFFLIQFIDANKYKIS